MTEYQSVSGVRIGLQIATTALFYCAARYKKVDGLTSAASRIGVAVALQGVSQKVRSPLGERLNVNWLIDGMALGLVAYGMKYTDLAKRTKGLVGGAIFGSQLAISNLQPNTALGCISRIETKRDCQAALEELKQTFQNYEASISPQKGINTCRAFFQRAAQIHKGGIGIYGSPAEEILPFYRTFLGRLEGWKQIEAQMEFIEMLDRVHYVEKSFLRETYFTESLGVEEGAQLSSWMEQTGMPIKLLWLTREMEKSQHEEVYGAITQYIEGIGDKISVDQKIELCQSFVAYSWRGYNFEEHKKSPVGRMLKFYKRFIENLEGIEKAKAHMGLAEFLSERCTQNHGFSRRVVTVLMSAYFAMKGIKATLDESGKAYVNAWMKDKGQGIYNQWNDTYREAKRRT